MIVIINKNRDKKIPKRNLTVLHQFHSLTSLRLEEVAAPRAGDATEKHGPRHAPPAGSRKREAESRQRKVRAPSNRDFYLRSGAR